MRIVHCITGLSGDGAQRMLLRLAEQLQVRGLQNYVLSLSGPEPLAKKFEALGIPVRALGMRRSLKDLFALSQVRRVLCDMRPDVLQGWMYHANVALSTVAPFLGSNVPVLWNIRRGMDDYAERKLSTRMFVQAGRLLSPYPQRIIYCTSESRAQHESFGFDARVGMVLGNGFNTDEFAPNEEKRRSIRARYGISDDDILIGSVGRDDSAKGREYLFEAFAELAERFPQARLLLVGRGLDDSNLHLRRTLVTRRIAARVILIGEYSPVSELYPAMDILCSSSVSEGFPNVVAEGMSSSLPCVATETGNSRDLLEGCGVVVPPRSGSRLAQGLGSLCGETQESRRARGRRARERIVAEFSLSSVVSSYVSLYERLGSRSGGGERFTSPTGDQGAGVPRGAILDVLGDK